MNQLDKALDAYVQQGSYSMFKGSTAITVDESAFRPEIITLDDANVVRADMLAGVDREAEAKVLLESVLRDDPKNAAAYEAMGLLQFRENDIQGAKKSFSEAVQLDSHSYIAHYYYYATMSLQAGDTGIDDSIESSLRACIKLDPSFAPAYDTLARFYGSRHEKLDEAHMLGVAAITLEPEELNYRLNASSVLMEQKQYDNALNVLRAAMRVAKTPAETAMVQSRIGMIQQYQSQVAQAETTRGPVQPGTSEVSKESRTVSTSGPETPKERTFIAATASTPHHTAKGTLHNVKCSYPAVLTLDVGQPGKTISLFAPNYFKITFTTLNYKVSEDIEPCKAIDGMKASVEYADVEDKTVAGQILSIQLSH